MKTTSNKHLKKIAAITMARNDEFFLGRWIKYYGNEIGTENLYIYLDGTDQTIPKNAGGANIKNCRIKICRGPQAINTALV